MAQNYYNLTKKVKVHNPGLTGHGLSVPFRMCCIGNSGSGKTNVCLDIMHKMSNTFRSIIICCKSKEEPLYEYLEKKIPEGLTFIEILSKADYPDITEVEPDTLIIFDDLCLEKDQSKIAEFFIRGRKKNISCIYISQSYFCIPKVIRSQCNYIILKKINSVRDLSMILADFPLDIKLDQLKDIYSEATKSFQDFLLIDVNNNTFSKNYSAMI